MNVSSRLNQFACDVELVEVVGDSRRFVNEKTIQRNSGLCTSPAASCPRQSVTAAALRPTRSPSRKPFSVGVIEPPDPMEDYDFMFDPEFEIYGGADNSRRDLGVGEGQRDGRNRMVLARQQSRDTTTYRTPMSSSSCCSISPNQLSWQLPQARGYSTIIGKDGHGYGYGDHYSGQSLVVPTSVRSYDQNDVLSNQNRQQASVVPERNVVSPVIAPHSGESGVNWRFVKRADSGRPGQKGNQKAGGYGGPKLKLTLSASLRDVKEWSVHKSKFELVFDVYGMVDSEVSIREFGRHEFLLRDHSDASWISYYEIDSKLPDLNRGDWVRIAAVMRPWHLQSVHVRVIPPESIRVIKQKIDNSRRLLDDKLKGR